MKNLLLIVLASTFLISCGKDDNNEGGTYILIEELRPTGQPEVGQTSKSTEDIKNYKHFYDQDSNQSYECHYQKETVEKLLIGFENQTKISIYQKATLHDLKQGSDQRCEREILDNEDIYSVTYAEVLEEMNSMGKFKDEALRDCIGNCTLVVKNRADGTAYVKIAGTFRSDEDGVNPQIDYTGEVNMKSPWLEAFKSSVTSFTIEFNGQVISESTREVATLGFKDDMSDFSYVIPTVKTEDILPAMANKNFVATYGESKYRLERMNGIDVLINDNISQVWLEDSNSTIDCHVTTKKYITDVEANTLAVQKGDLDPEVLAFIIKKEEQILDKENTHPNNLNACKQHYGDYENTHEAESFYRKSYFKVIDEDNYEIDIRPDWAGTRISKQ